MGTEAEAWEAQSAGAHGHSSSVVVGDVRHVCLTTPRA